MSLNEDVNGGIHIIFLIICTFYTRLAKRDSMLDVKLSSIMKPDVVLLTGKFILYYASVGYLIRPLQYCSNRRTDALHLPDKMKCCESYTVVKQNSNRVRKQLRPYILSGSACVWLSTGFGLLTTYTHDSELQIITWPPLILIIHISPQHPLSLFQPPVSSPAVPWQRLLTVEILQFQALRFYFHSLSCRTAYTHKNQSHVVTDGQSVSQSWCRAPSVAHDQIFITVWQLQSCFCGAPSLMRGRVCLLSDSLSAVVSHLSWCKRYLHFTC
jgi:hypothetical protein